MAEFNFSTLFHIVEVFFILELVTLHAVLLGVFAMWLVRHALHEMNSLKLAWREFKSTAMRPSGQVLPTNPPEPAGSGTGLGPTGIPSSQDPGF